MPGPARAGALIFAKDLDTLSRFYEQLLGMRLVAAEPGLRVIENGDIQMVIHAMPPHIAAQVEISLPPEAREDQAIKPFFTIDTLASAESIAAGLGGYVFGPTWDGPGFRIRNACDPEGNIIQLREWT